MREKIIMAVVWTALLVAAMFAYAWFEDYLKTRHPDTAAIECIDGVSYLRFSSRFASAVTVQYTPEGKVKSCKDETYFFGPNWQK